MCVSVYVLTFDHVRLYIPARLYVQLFVFFSYVYVFVLVFEHVCVCSYVYLCVCTRTLLFFKCLYLCVCSFHKSECVNPFKSVIHQ